MPDSPEEISAASVKAKGEKNAERIKFLCAEIKELREVSKLQIEKLETVDHKVDQVIKILSTFGAGSRSELKVLGLESDQAK